MVTVSSYTADEWLSFFEQPDVAALCRTIAVYPNDLTPRYIWLDWLDEHSPDPKLPQILRKHIDARNDEPIPSLTGVLGFAVKCSKGRLRIEADRFDRRHERLCSSGAVQFAEFDDLTIADGRRLIASASISKLFSLAARYGNLGAEGATALANSPHLANLVELDLHYNGIGAKGAAALAGSPHLANLVSLCLTSNRIGVEGVTALANSPHLVNLTELKIEYSQMGAEGAAALAGSPYLREEIRKVWR